MIILNNVNIPLYLSLLSLFINQDDVSSLRAKITVLEDELCKSRQDSSEYQNLVRKLENVMCCLFDLANYGYTNFCFIYSLIILSMIYAGGKRVKRSGTTREAKGGQNFLVFVTLQGLLRGHIIFC